MKRLIVLLYLLFSLKANAGLCPDITTAQSVIDRIVKAPLIVRNVKPLPSFNACEVETESGETFFLSRDGDFLIEGILIKVKKPKLLNNELSILNRNVVYSFGRFNNYVIVVTNPDCKACKRDKEMLKQFLKNRVSVRVVFAAFNKREFNDAVSAICNNVSFRNMFKPMKKNICDIGKLRVWEVSDILKRHGITGTPVTIFRNGNLRLGLSLP